MKIRLDCGTTNERIAWMLGSVWEMPKTGGVAPLERGLRRDATPSITLGRHAALLTYQLATIMCENNK